MDPLGVQAPMESPNTITHAPEDPSEIKPGTQGPATDYLDRLSRREIIGTPNNIADAVHEWRQTPGWLALEAAARTIGHHKGSRGLADKLLEATTLGTVVRAIAIAHDRLTKGLVPDGEPVPVPIGEQLKALNTVGRWQGLDPQRAGSMVQVVVQSSMEPPPRTVLVEQSETPKDQQSGDQDKAGL